MTNPPYDNTVCPVCGKNVHQEHVWSHCPLHRAMVCMEHCTGCPFRNARAPHCRYHATPRRTHNN